MKTNIFKMSIAFVALLGTLKVYSQSSSHKKTCINIVEINNGKTIRIDTCFTGLSDAEIQKQLSALGVSDIQLAKNISDTVNIIADKVAEETDSIKDRIIIINKDKNDSTGNGKVNVISRENGRCNVVVMGGNGYSYSTTSSNDNSSSETEVIMDGGGKGGDNSHNGVKVIILRNITVNDLSDSDKLKLRNGIPSETQPFSNLRIYPNPAQTSLILSYNSSSNEPLKITIYDENGKVVYTETLNKPGEQVNKSISLSGYAPDIYFVNILQGKQQETKKIIIGK